MTLSQIRAAAGRKGGNAPHKIRGFQAMTADKRRVISSLGGKARHGKALNVMITRRKETK